MSLFAVTVRKTAQILLLMSVSATLAAKQQVFGWIEKASMPEIGVIAKVKMDTGALTSSIHVTSVERFDKDEEDWVRFTVKLQDSDSQQDVVRVLERPFHRKIKISGAGGVDNRLVVYLDICIGDRLLREQFSLSNRSDKKYGMLIGRRTIENIGVVDVNKTFTSQPECSSSQVGAL